MILIIIYLAALAWTTLIYFNGDKSRIILSMETSADDGLDYYGLIIGGILIFAHFTSKTIIQSIGYETKHNLGVMIFSIILSLPFSYFLIKALPKKIIYQAFVMALTILVQIFWYVVL
jgi:hypothetical protein